MTVHRDENSSGVAKFFNPTSKSINWKSPAEKKAYTAASTIFGIATLGIGHGIYQIVKKVTKNDPDTQKIQTNINNGKLEVHKPASVIPPISFYNMDSEFQRNNHVDRKIKSSAEYILEENDEPTQIIMGISNLVIEANKTSTSKDLEVRLLNDKYAIGLCDELISNDDWLARCTSENKQEINGLVDMLLKQHENEPKTIKENELYKNLIELKNQINTKIT